jgi:hypothetical protein
VTSSPPPESSGSRPTQIAGQQSEPTSTVPYTPGLAYTPAREHTNTMAIVSVVTGMLAVFGHVVLPGIGGGMLAIVAIVTGFIARGEIRRTGEQGGWMAMVGIVLGVLHILVIAGIIILLILGIFVFGTWALLHKG